MFAKALKVYNIPLRLVNFTLIFAKSELQMKLSKQTAIFCFVLIFSTTLIKIICAPRLEFSGTTGIMAAALFAGFANIDKKQAFLLPLVTLFVSNVIVEILFRLNMFPFAGFYKWQFVEYALLGFALTAIGMVFRKLKTAGVVISAFVGPTVFFIISNFIVWYASRGSMGYTNDFRGVLNCYIAGLPFYRNSVSSTLILLPVFIVSYQWLVKGKLVLSLAK